MQLREQGIAFRVRSTAQPKAPSREIYFAVTHRTTGLLGRWTIGTLGILISTAAGAQVSFSDIQTWVGSGQNQAAFVIDWKSGATPQSQVWGYRWDGVSTGSEMINAIVAADNRLYREWASGYVNEFVFGYGLDRDGDGFAKTDPADSYQEGFFTNGYWGYYVDVAPSSSLPAWTFSQTGAAGRVLANALGMAGVGRRISSGQSLRFLSRFLLQFLSRECGHCSLP